MNVRKSLVLAAVATGLFLPALTTHGADRRVQPILKRPASQRLATLRSRIRKPSSTFREHKAAKKKGSRPGHVFETRSGSRFVRRHNGYWTEYRRNGTWSQFRLVSESQISNLKYNLVRLYDRTRKISVVLGPHEALWKRDGGKKFTKWPGSEGSWKR